MQAEAQILIINLDKVHTTQLGTARIIQNLSLGAIDPVEFCLQQMKDPNSSIVRRGKNWYVQTDFCEITVNATSYTIITAHKRKLRS